CQPLAIRDLLIAPNIRFPVETTARGEFPLGFGWQTLVRPVAIGHRVVPANMNDGIFFASFDFGTWSFGMPPVCARNPFPPDVMIGEGHVPGRRIEDDRTGHEHLP